MRSLIIHGGAGRITRERILKKLPVMWQSLDAGWPYMKEGDGAGAVANAVKVMEDCEYFNAGYGGYPNANKIVLLDAAIMNGKREFVALMNVRRIKRPIMFALGLLKPGSALTSVWTHELMEQLDNAVEEVRQEYGWVATHEEMLPKYVEDLLRKNEAEFSVDGTTNGTVGACSRTADRQLFAAISTGGVNHKVNGRIGDAPMIGLGLYADNDICAYTTTGNGEALLACFPTGFIIGRVRDALKSLQGDEADAAFKNIMMEEFNEFGKKSPVKGGGIIGISRGGKPAYALSADAMPVGIRSEKSDGTLEDRVFIVFRDGRVEEHSR